MAKNWGGWQKMLGVDGKRNFGVRGSKNFEGGSKVLGEQGAVKNNQHSGMANIQT